MPSLAEKINAATAAAESHAQSAMHYALEAGGLLNEAKLHVEHGDWETWLTANCTIAPRTAQAYMRLAKTVPLLPPAKAQRVADLPVREAIRAIATNPERPPARPAPLRFKNHADADRAADALKKCAGELRKAVRRIKQNDLKRAQVLALRSTLANATDALDLCVRQGQIDQPAGQSGSPGTAPLADRCSS